MIGNCEHGRDVERGAVDNAFGIGSRPLWVTMAMFGCGYLAVTLYANADVTGVWQWVGIIAGFLFFAAGGFLILDAPGDPLPMPTTVVIAVLAVAGVTASLFSLPFPLTHAMQTGPSMGASVVILAFVAVRGRPLAAWSASIVISLIATEWGHLALGDAMWGLAVTLPGYAIMIMGSLFHSCCGRWPGSCTDCEKPTNVRRRETPRRPRRPRFAAGAWQRSTNAPGRSSPASPTGRSSAPRRWPSPASSRRNSVMASVQRISMCRRSGTLPGVPGSGA
ncbi:hypothetical protein GORBP_015_00190 [Gordonia rubripertincta NBRC 101908]|uniref:Uncharacterized protein n=1 Tax=Gordonia rubripertincta NBRC 101908 TaxID=1077975 RepID=A0ABQ0HNE9_GORRU|nr:hypothetical protein GORBP_015_00190 [Gordonia rubripertincta NBRC 101908]